MKFVKESRIAAPPEAVFAFHESPSALAQLIPPWEKVRIESPAQSLSVGTKVTLKSQMGPFRLRWVAEHTDYDPPHGFTDRQVSGPFKRWVHRHGFLPDGYGGTILRDEIDYEIPLGRIGGWLGSRFVTRKLERMFEYRHAKTRELLERERSPIQRAESISE